MNSVGLIYVLLTYCFSSLLAQDDFLGCGGFVKVEKGVGLDMSKIEIRL